MPTTTRRTSLWLTALPLLGLARCNCDEGPEVQRAAVEMQLGFIEQDSCSQAAVQRRIPDDYERTGQAASTDFGSRAERRFEIRSIGTAPLTVTTIELSAEDPEFSLEVFLGDETTPATFPLTIPASKDTTGPAGAVVKASFSAVDGEPDLVELIVRSDDPKRQDVRFKLSAGRGQVLACGSASAALPDGCGEVGADDLNGDGQLQMGEDQNGNGALDPGVAVVFGNVPICRDSSCAGASQRLVIKNAGQGDLDLFNLRLESTSAEFCAPEVTELANAAPDCPLVQLCRVLKPGEEYVVNVTYKPRDGGLDLAKLVLVSGDAARGNLRIPIYGVGSGPALCPCLVETDGSCTPASVLDFGAVSVGDTASRNVRLVSCGTEPAELSEAALDPDPPFRTGPEFQVSTAFPLGTLAPMAYAEGAITYRPTGPGTHSGGLRYVTPQLQLRSWLPVVGRAATCDLVALPTTVDFGTVAGGSSSERIVALVNNGASPCQVTAISDPPNAAFTFVARPATLPATVGPGGSLELRLRYTSPARPTPQAETSSFQVTSNELPPNQTQTIQLLASGGGTPVCAVDVQPTGNSPIPSRQGTLRFGPVNIGYSKTLPISIRNTGNTDCTLQSFSLVTQATNQVVVNPIGPGGAPAPVPMAIPAGARVELSVVFSPTGPGPMISIPPGTYGSFSNHVDFVLQGAGLAQPNWSIGIQATPTVPTIDVIPDAVDFGLVAWQNPAPPPDNTSMCQSRERVVNIYNSGSGNLHVDSVAIDGTSDRLFLITSVTNGGTAVAAPYVMDIPPGGSASVFLRFKPSRVNPAQHSGLLLVENNVTGAGNPVTVPLTGQGTPNTNQTDTFQQVQDNKVDILWVVDDSGSMSEEQQNLAANFGQFIGFADTQGVDYQIGVITTEINDPPAGKLWACNGYNKIIRSSDPPATRQAAFSCAANVTSPPGGNQRPNPGGSDEAEAGLQAARLALDAPIRDNENAGFLRADARLAVIIVSDEEDQSPGPVSLYVDFFRNVKGFANPQLVNVSAIAGDVPSGCATAEAGQRYFDAVNQLRGQYESICVSSWSNLLMNLGLGVIQLRTAWTLSRPAEPATITVRVNGMNVPGSATNGWTYDAATNTVTFHGSAVPLQGATIEIQYGVVCNP